MSVRSDSYAVLLPAISDLTISPQLARFFDEGGRSLLLGETREEYLARSMSPDRRASETTAAIEAMTADIARRAGPSIIAVDQEPAGIQRLHRLVPPLPSKSELHSLPAAEIERAAFNTALAARKMGITMFLSPVLDVVTGRNPWLSGRTLGTDVAEVVRICVAYIKGVEAAGIIATPKHFPGHHDIDDDPATRPATVSGSKSIVRAGFRPFREAAHAGARAMMTGPALVPGLDAVMPSSLSTMTIRALRQDLEFDGLIVSDDLDAIGTLRGKREVPTAAVEALRAGADLLMLSAENDLAGVRDAIIAAVGDGLLPQARLAEAASRVRALADDTARS